MFPIFEPRRDFITPFLFFTGKGGVGKTSTASALAVFLADQGKRVLIVSTDPASNLQDVFEVELSNEIIPIPGEDRLFGCNLDPEESARAYRERVVGPYRGKLPESVLQSMEEQLSGACTVEIAAFDEFTNLLANEQVRNDYDHIIFDTAPTGHTLRLLQLPMAWTDFLNESTHGASCLGPLSGLSDKKDLYAKTVGALSDSGKTTLVLVARPDTSSLLEAERASKELGGIGIQNQLVLINGVLQSFTENDLVSRAFYQKQQNALENFPTGLRGLSIFEVPLVSFPLTGIAALGKLFEEETSFHSRREWFKETSLPNLNELIDDLHGRGVRLVFTMGKGGVGKTTIASAIAIGLAEKGHHVHLTTTDPAAHLSYIFEKEEKNLTISRIDPKLEVERYRQEVLSKVSAELDEHAIAYIKEDLESPCTEEIAVFRAFADEVAKVKEQIVVIDTAPTGHTLLLLDAAQSYHKELERSTGEIPESVQSLLPRLRNEGETEVVIVTLPEATPVLEAKRLQEDLFRANIKPHWWIVNQSFVASNTMDPVLGGRAKAETDWIQKVSDDLAQKVAVIPWLKEDMLNAEILKETVINRKER
jgi:arsenite/tail-anchored protein-transporting ATPase